MFRLFLEGVYNNGEVPWLDLKWLFYKVLLRSRTRTVLFDSIVGEYAEVMPERMLIRYGDWQGTLVWKYRIENDRVSRFKGWKNSITNNPMEDTDFEQIILKLHEELVYEMIDEHLSS